MPSLLCPFCSWGHGGTTKVNDLQLIMMKPTREYKQSAPHNVCNDHASWRSNWVLSSNNQSNTFQQGTGWVLLWVWEEMVGCSAYRVPSERYHQESRTSGKIAAQVGGPLGTQLCNSGRVLSGLELAPADHIRNSNASDVAQKLELSSQFWNFAMWRFSVMC